MLTAIDGMSNVVNNATNSAMASMKKLKDYSISEFGNGFMMLEAGKAGFDSMKPAIDAFGDMQEAGIRLQNSLMKDGGAFDGKMYDKMYKSAQKLSDGYTGSTEDYLQMMAVLKNNRIAPDEILGGIGEATAKLGHLFKMHPAAIGEFAAHMRNDMGVAVKDMYQVMDLTQRVQAVGVGKTGEEAVYEMNQFFSKVGLGLTNLKSQGIESAKAMGSLGAIFMRKGLSGENVGTNFRRILDGLRDPTKIAKANEIGAQYGKTLSFYDKKGNFAGIENFVAQLDKLKGLDTQKIAEVLKPFSGRQGLSTDFLELLAHNGVEEFNAMNKDLFKQGTLTQKERNLSKGQNQNLAILKSSWKNTIAEIGAVAAPLLTKTYVLLNKVSIALRNLVHNHPMITKMVLGFIAIASAALMIGGAFKIFKVAMGLFDTIMGISKAIKFLRIAFAILSPSLWAAISATWSFTVALLANPITWIVLAVVALGVAVYELIKHWNVVGPFFSKMWKSVKGFFSDAVSFIWKKILPFFMPQVLIIQHWDKIGPYFAKLWNDIKKIFMGVVYWMGDQATAFYNAGKNIVLNVWNGIKSLAHKPVEAMREMVGKIRNLLPFSPAKDGPLKDIHRIRLIETISESLQAAPLLNKMRSIATQVFELRPQQASISPLLAASGGNVTIHLKYAPVYHAAPGEQPGAANDSFMKWANDNKRQLMEMIRREMGDGRKSYS